MPKAEILVVEDERIVGLDIKRTLERLGYTVPAIVTSGERAIHQATESRPDLVLMDIRLKGAMDGVEAAAQIQAQLDVPVVFLTAYADDATLSRAGAIAPFGYLLKPFEERVLHTTIEMALCKHKMETENARLYAEVQERVGELTSLNNISQTLNSSLNLQEILTLIADHANRLLGVAATSVILRDPVRGDLWFAAASGEGADFVCGKRLALGQGIVGRVTRDGIPALVSDVSQDPGFFDRFDQKSGFTTRSILCAPLQVQGHTIGAIEAVNNKGVVFDEEDLALLTSLAAPAATAIENARLHTETERNAEQLAVLHELDRAITASLRITDVYHALACHAGRLLAYDHLSITVIEGTDARVAYVIDQEDSGLSTGITLSLQTSSLGWVIARGQPLLRHSMADDTRFAGDRGLLAGGIESMMIVPLRVKARIIGTCNIGSRQVGAYDPDDLEIAQRMADQLAVAIENARLFEAEQSARQTAEILRTANLAFTKTLDLAAVLEALLDYLGQFVLYDTATIMLVDTDSRVVLRAGRAHGGQTGIEQSSAAAVNVQNTPVYSTLLRTGESLLVPDTGNHPGWEYPAGEEHIRSVLGMPLVANGEIIGLCLLGKTQSGFFSAEHRRLAESLAAQAAIAIQNARLFEQVRVGRERLQTLSRRLVEIQEMERRHIARELHDQAGQALSSLAVGLRLLEEAAERGEAVAAHLVDLKQTIDTVSEGLHQLASDLRPASLDHLGLVATLRQYTEAFSHQHGLIVQFEMVGLEDGRLPPMVETALYRIVQEALTNVVRHAQANRADVVLERQGDRVITIVEDDGVGFDYGAAMQNGRLGLIGMQERAEMLGGNLVVESSPGAGTTLLVEVPYACSYSDS
jgi:signal transduction histidine kinase/DNA-binding NarL/FixJ family response regulator